MLFVNPLEKAENKMKFSCVHVNKLSCLCLYNWNGEMDACPHGCIDKCIWRNELPERIWYLYYFSSHLSNPLNFWECVSDLNSLYYHQPMTHKSLFWFEMMGYPIKHSIQCKNSLQSPCEMVCFHLNI